MRVKVYAGLSLDEQGVCSILPDCCFAGPVRRDDLLGDIRAGTQVVVIIDGRFQQSLAVSAGEIMDALRCGVRVYGASSMGALRAAELSAYGMTGFGAIFDLVAARPWFRDDYLGQVFAERDLRSGSTPYMNVHFGLRALVDEGVIDEEEHALLAELCRDMHFAERTAQSFERAIGERQPLRKEALLAAAKRAMAHDQKRLDALGVLRLVASDLQRVAQLNQQILTSQRESRYDESFDPAFELKVGILLGP